jgi:CO dehydrogenase/acetyl-CoA synthase epsilon subunit
MIAKGKKLAEYLRGKRVVVIAGQLCEEVEFGGKKLLDYVVEIANKLNAPIAAAGNTAIPLRERGARSVTKMWAIELTNFMRWPWEKDKEHPKIMDEKPEVLIFVGYSAPVAQGLVSTIKEEDGITVVLGSKYIEGATFSFPDAASFKQWERNLKEFVASLEG